MLPGLGLGAVAEVVLVWSRRSVPLRVIQSYVVADELHLVSPVDPDALVSGEMG